MISSAKELKENLTKIEAELMNTKKNESALKNKIYQLEVENTAIKKSSDKISKFGLNRNLINSRSMKNLNLANIKENSLKNVVNYIFYF